jgi:hypothetical protein
MYIGFKSEEHLVTWCGCCWEECPIVLGWVVPGETEQATRSDGCANGDGGGENVIAMQNLKLGR